MVDGVISELGLSKVRGTIVGDEMSRGVSGGEKKRVNIGVELLSDPHILFLDEPTSGLDAFQAQSVMKSLTDLSNNNRLVFSVIHQPRSSIYAMFDKILLLSEGRLMFFGDASPPSSFSSGNGVDDLDIDPSSTALSYFESIGYPVPNHFNPADHFLDILSIDYRSEESEFETKARIQSIGDLWLKKEEELENEIKEDDIESQQKLNQVSSTNKGEEEGGNYSPKSSESNESMFGIGSGKERRSWIASFGVLTKRSFIEIYRNKVREIFMF